MKGVVLEIRKGKAAVLFEDGSVGKVRNLNYRVGEEILLKKPALEPIKRAAAIAAAVIVLGVAGGTGVYATPYTYVSFDVNPSIEYTVNRFGRVIAVEAVDEEGQKVLDEANLGMIRNRTIEDALGNTYEAVRRIGYFNDDSEDSLLVAAACGNTDDARKMTERLTKYLRNKVEDDQLDAPVEGISLNNQERLKAKESGLSMGRYELVNQIKEQSGEGQSDGYDQWKGETVNELMNTLKEKGSSSVTENGGSGENAGSGQNGSKK